MASLVKKDMTTINSFQELIDYNYSIIGGEYSHYYADNMNRSGFKLFNELKKNTDSNYLKQDLKYDNH